jgi:hypothetical protein
MYRSLLVDTVLVLSERHRCDGAKEACSEFLGKLEGSHGRSLQLTASSIYAKSTGRPTSLEKVGILISVEFGWCCHL